MNSLEQKLNQHLFRHNCPDPLVLGEYHLDLLDASDRGPVADHLSLCPRCRREVAQLAGFLQATTTADADAVRPAEPTLLEQVKIYLLDLLAPLEGEEAGAPAPVWRAGEDNLQEQTQFRVRRAGEYLVSITIQPGLQGQQRLIVGDVVHMEQPGATFDEWTVHFWQSKRLERVMPLDPSGSFVLETEQAAPFEVILSGPDIEIHLQHKGHG